jgi:predicted enzyme related to lactoylglutathione lyase
MAVLRITVNIETADLERLRDLYSDVFALRVDTDKGWSVGLGPSAAGAIGIVHHDPTSATVAALTIEVDDIADVHERVLHRDLEIVSALTSERWGVRRFAFRDTAGTVVGVEAREGRGSLTSGRDRGSSAERSAT